MVDPEAPTRPTTAPDRGGAADETPLPESVGRYTLHEQLGRGGFGAVYAAHDPQLDRRVAIKLLHQRVDPEAAPLRRLAREARALAVLRHPNVVGVFDVGHVDEHGLIRPYIVMELVQGQSLRHWLRARTRSREEILRVLHAAGQGLVAAHAAGLVHRDFKPGNVLVGDHGQVKVADFGLARMSDNPALDEPVASGGSFSGSDDSGLEAVTERGVVMGTPPYMAPEQLGQGFADARADQFALCVTAWEALTGVRPFPSEGPPVRRATAIREGRLAQGPEPLPPRIEAALRRGLSFAPEDRHGSVEVLLDQLEPPRRRRWSVLAVVVAAAVTVALGVAWWPHEPPEPTCAAAQSRLAGIWDAEVRDAIRRSFVSTDLAYAADAADRVAARMDGHAARWSEGWVAACARLEASADPDGDRQLGCLRENLGALQAVTTVLTRADAPVVERAASLAAALPDPAECEAAGTSPIELDADTRREVEEVRGLLERADTQARAGRFEPAFATIEQARQRPATHRLAALRLEVDAKYGIVLDRAGRYDEAVAAMEAAYFAAADVGHVEVAARLATELVIVHGYRRRDPEQGLRWARHADTETQRARGADRLRTMLDGHLGVVHFARGDLEAAHAAFTRAAEQLEAQGPRGRAQLAKVLQNLASVQLRSGQRQIATQTFERSLASARATLGPRHPTVATTLNNLGFALASGGELVAALEHQQQALAIAREALGADHPVTLTTLNNVGELLVRVGRPEDALGPLREALAGRTAALGAEHPDVAVVLDNLGLALGRTGQSSEALERLARALEIQRAQPSPDPLGITASLHNRGEVHLGRGELDAAREHFEQALATLEPVVGTEHPQLAYSLTGLGEVALAQGRSEEAVDRLERAHRLRAEHPVASEVAVTSWALARALAVTGADTARIDGLAEQAEREFGRAGPAFAEQRDEVSAWRAGR